jgi:hypothetical protein
MPNIGPKSMKLKLSIVLLVLIGAAAPFSRHGLSGAVQAQRKMPQFRDYPVTDVYRGKTAPVVLTRDDRMFRTRLKRAAKEKPNFAGHYILTAWGCGTSCLAGAVIDAKTGKVYWWKFTVCCWGYDTDDQFKPIEFRLNSKLIVFSGARNEKDNDNGAHFYKFENGRFVHRRSILKPEL